jgi:hypothetical protein
LGTFVAVHGVSHLAARTRRNEQQSEERVFHGLLSCLNLLGGHRRCKPQTQVRNKTSITVAASLLAAIRESRHRTANRLAVTCVFGAARSVRPRVGLFFKLDCSAGFHSLSAAKRSSNVKVLSGRQRYYNRWNAAK